MYQNYPTVAAIQNSKNVPGDKTPDLRFVLGVGKFVFLMYQNSPKAMQNAHFLGDNIPDLPFQGRGKIHLKNVNYVIKE